MEKIRMTNISLPNNGIHDSFHFFQIIRQVQHKKQSVYNIFIFTVRKRLTFIKVAQTLNNSNKAIKQSLTEFNSA